MRRGPPCRRRWKMFGLLKQKLTGFLDKLVKKEEEKPSGAPTEEGMKKAEEALGARREGGMKKIEDERKPSEERKAADEKARKEAEEALRIAEEERKIIQEKEKSAEREMQKARDAAERAELERKDADEARKKAELEARKAEEEAKKLAHIEKMQKEEAARLKAHEETVRARDEERRAEIGRKKAEDEAKRLSIEAIRREEEAQRLALLKKHADAELKKAEDEANRAAVEKRKAEDAAYTVQEEEGRKKAAEERKKSEEEAKLKAAPAAPKKDLGFLGGIWPFGKKDEKKAEQPAAEKTFGIEEKPKGAHESKAGAKEAPAPAESKDDFDMERLSKKSESGEKKMEVRMGLARTVTTLFTNTVEIREEDIRDLADELELALLESDVAYEVSIEVAKRMKERLVGMKVSRSNMQGDVRAAMADVLSGVLQSEKAFDFFAKLKSAPKPVKVLFVGPNGAGKTTTMAKIAKQLSDRGMTSVISASDTFRAAAIEQAEVHGKKLGVHVVKSKYGADPASVAYDAVTYAHAHKTDVVLIDSAGRQDTNVNLLDELKKMVRVVKPDLKIYIGESIGGNATLDQIKAFSESIGLDGAILTKLDCDAKGGTALSVAHATGMPILFLGMGQGYDDLAPFDAKALSLQLVGASNAS